MQKAGKVIKDKRGYAVEVEGKKYYPPKGCDPIMDPQLEALVDKDVDVLFAKDEILALRPVEKLVKPQWPWPPIITCYLILPDIVFDPRILLKIEPMITESLVESGYLELEVVQQLHKWKRQAYQK